MDLLTPITSEQLRMYTDMPQHVRMLLQRCIGDIFAAMNSRKTSCLLETAIRHLQVRVSGEICQYDPNPTVGVPEFITLLQFKFPGCKIKHLQDHWYEVDSTTRRKVTAILIDWSVPVVPPTQRRGRRGHDMTKCFTDGLPLRHTIASTNHTLEARYDMASNEIVCNDGSRFKSPCGFVNHHYEQQGYASGSRDGWKECQCRLNGTWVSARTLLADDDRLTVTSLE